MSVFASAGSFQKLFKNNICFVIRNICNTFHPIKNVVAFIAGCQMFSNDCFTALAAKVVLIHGQQIQNQVTGYFLIKSSYLAVF